MSRYSEIINLKAMTAKLLDDGEVIAEYKVETCDKCARITQLDKFGYQKSDPANNLIWFCKECDNNWGLCSTIKAITEQLL